jgi:hypothetical protein
MGKWRKIVYLCCDENAITPKIKMTWTQPEISMEGLSLTADDGCTEVV